MKQPQTTLNTGNKKNRNGSNRATPEKPQELEQQSLQLHLDLDPERYERPRLVFEDGALVLKALKPEARNLLPSYFV